MINVSWGTEKTFHFEFHHLISGASKKESQSSGFIWRGGYTTAWWHNWKLYLRDYVTYHRHINMQCSPTIKAICKTVGSLRNHMVRDSDDTEALPRNC